MVDPQQFYLREGLSQEGFEISVKLIDKDKLEGDELLLCYSHDPAVSLTLKCSGWCDVSFVTDVEYNTAAFEALVLPAEKKEMIRSIMKQQERPSSPSFDDLIEGKGKGLIMLLHGPPGVGKTFTAESIADFIPTSTVPSYFGRLGPRSSYNRTALGTAFGASC